MIATRFFLLAACACSLGAAAAPRELTDEQKKQFQELEADIAREERLIATIPDAELKALSMRTLEAVKVRVAEARENFDATKFDEIRFEVLIEHQRLARWVENPVLTTPRTNYGPPPPNTVSELEQSAGWRLLFDGRTFSGWRGYNQKAGPVKGWSIADGMLHTIPAKALGGVPKGGGHPGVDLITERTFTDFELSWEWRIAPGANNGVKYFVTEARPKAPGHEYQMADAGTRSDERNRSLQGIGSFYDVLPANTAGAIKPAGEWNVSRLVVRGTRVEHWLNGKKILAYHTDSPEVKAGVAKSKFKDQPGFGGKITGHLMLTYHDDECWFRNVKVREFE